jgi:hypothetical protein
MTASNPDFASQPKFTPPAFEEPPRQHGCFFYGCIIAGVLALLLLIAISVGLYLFYQWVGKQVEQYTSTTPRELPTVNMPAEERKTLQERVEAFQNALKEGKPTEPLVLDADDINALIDEQEEFKGKVYVSIDEDKLKGQISIPLDKFPLFGLTRGRYLNGEAEIKATIANDVLVVTLQSIEVNGKQVPEEAMAQIRGQNLAQDAYKDAKKADQLRNLESIEIKDGKLTIKAKDRTKKAAGESSRPEPKIETKDGKVIVHPPEEKPAPKSGTGPATKDIPDVSPARSAEPAKKSSD